MSSRFVVVEGTKYYPDPTFPNRAWDTVDKAVPYDFEIERATKYVSAFVPDLPKLSDWEWRAATGGPPFFYMRTEGRYFRVEKSVEAIWPKPWRLCEQRNGNYRSHTRIAYFDRKAQATAAGEEWASLSHWEADRLPDVVVY